MHTRRRLQKYLLSPSCLSHRKRLLQDGFLFMGQKQMKDVVDAIEAIYGKDA